MFVRFVNFFRAHVIGAMIFLFGLLALGGYFWSEARLNRLYGDLPRYSGQAIGYLGAEEETLRQFPESAVAQRRTELKQIAKKLKKNPHDYDGWLELGVIKKFFNNYEGARDAWEYAKLVNATSSLSYFNLGGLYANYLNDYPRAEENYKKAIARDRLFFPQYHVALADFYKRNYVEKRDLAEPTLLEGIAAIPEDAGLRVQLALLYKERGERDKALRYFKEALKLNPELVEVKREIELLEAR